MDKKSLNVRINIKFLNFNDWNKKFTVTEQKELVSTENIFSGSDFTELALFEVVAFEQLQIGDSEIPFFDGDLIIFGDTVKKIENGVKFHFLSQQEDELLELVSCKRSILALLVVLLYHLTGLANQVFLVKNNFVVLAQRAKAVANVVLGNFVVERPAGLEQILTEIIGILIDGKDFFQVRKLFQGFSTHINVGDSLSVLSDNEYVVFETISSIIFKFI